MSGLSPVAVVVANVRRIRRKRGLTAQQLSDRLCGVGMNIGRVGVAKMEGGNRRTITIENLFALAEVLNVSPLSLLIPEDEGELVDVTPTTVATGKQVALWVAGERPLRDEGMPGWIDFVRELPHWKMASFKVSDEIAHD